MNLEVEEFRSKMSQASSSFLSSPSRGPTKSASLLSIPTNAVGKSSSYLSAPKPVVPKPVVAPKPSTRAGTAASKSKLLERFKGGRGGSGGSILDRSGFVFGTGVLNSCPSEDKSFFCQFSRVFNVIMMVLTLAFIAYFAYALLTSKTRFFGGALRSIKRRTGVKF